MASLRGRLVRKTPLEAVGEEHDTGLERSIGLFQLTMFGVSATVGTGIFFVLSEAVPEAGPSATLSFVLAAIGPG